MKKIQARKRKIPKNSMIIRLVDVVFILLFGFISISEIDRKSQIKLPKSIQVPPSMPDKEQVIFIGVLPDGAYLVDDEMVSITEVSMLEKYIYGLKKQLLSSGIKMKVRVRANYDASVKYAFRVVEICQNGKIPVGLDVIKTKG